MALSKLALICTVAGIVLFAKPATAQGEVQPFLSDSLNIISDESGSLNTVLETLYNLQGHEDTTSVVAILHLGDSHIQAGFFTRIIRTSLQKEFGNAGLGLIVPLKLAGTNQPRDYRITSDGSWAGGRCSLRKDQYTFGVSGFAVETTDSCAALTIEARYDATNQMEYDFNKLTVFHNKAPVLLPEDDTIVSLEHYNPYAYTIELNRHVTTLPLIQNGKSNAKAKTYHGFSLENGKSGILYHVAGVNGARYDQLCGIQLLVEQSKALNPQIIVISQGTNESLMSPFSSTSFISDIDRLVKKLKQANPNAVFILTTPAETYRRQKRQRIPNANIELVSKAIVTYAKENNIAYWDLFELSGGKGSSQSWKKNGLLAKDQLHFTIEGYEQLGRLFTEAFLKLYSTYVGKHRLE